MKIKKGFLLPFANKLSNNQRQSRKKKIDCRCRELKCGYINRI